MSKQNKKIVPVPAVQAVEPLSRSKYDFPAPLNALILFLLAFGIYANTIPNFYTLDDIAAFTQNKLVQQGVKGIPKILTTGFSYGYTGENEGTYRPVSLVSFAIEKSLWGNNPHLSHFINVLIFAISIVLLFFLLRKMMGSQMELLCFICAALYAAHPIHTEAVASIKSRDELFCLFFLLISIYSFFKAYDSNEKAGTSLTWGFFGLLGFFLSLISKETTLPFVVIIPLSLYYFRPITIKELSRVFVICLAATGSYLFLRHSLFGSIVNIKAELQKVDNFMAVIPWSSHFSVAFSVIGKYIWLLIFPNSLSFDYSYHQVPTYTWSDWQALLPFLIAAGGIAFALFTIAKKRIEGYPILFFFLSLGVISNIFVLIGSVMGERFLYIPSLGFCILIGLLIYKYLLNGKNLSAVGWIVFGAIMLLYSVRTISRNRDWKDNFSLYSNDVKTAPNSCRTHYSLGTEYSAKASVETDPGQKKLFYTKAEEELQKAIDINPQYSDAIINLGNVYHNLGQFDKEVQSLGSIQSDPKGLSEVLYNTGNALLEQGNYRGAVYSYRRSIESNGNFAPPYVNIGSAYCNLNMPDSAIYFLEKGIALEPDVVKAYVNLGSAYSAKGKTAKAIDIYIKALQLDPNSAELDVNLGSAYINMGKLKEAITYLNKAITITKDIPEAYYNLGYAYQLSKEYSQAIEGFKKAVQLRPAYPEAYLNMGFCAMSLNRYDEALNYYNQVLKLSPGQYNAWLAMAYIYKKEGNNTKAQECQQRGNALKASGGKAIQ